MRRGTILLVAGSALSAAAAGVLVLYTPDPPDPALVEVARVRNRAADFRGAWDARDLDAIAGFYPEDQRSDIKALLPTFLAQQRLGGWPKISITGDPEVFGGGIRVDFVMRGSARMLYTDWEKLGDDWMLVRIDFN